MSAVTANRDDSPSDPRAHLDYRSGWRPAVVAGIVAVLAVAVGGIALANSLRGHDDPTPTPSPQAAGHSDSASPSPLPSRTTRPSRSPRPSATTSARRSPSATTSTAATDWPTSYPFFAKTVSSSRALPSREAWLRDVAATLAKSRVRDYLHYRASGGGDKLAINLDIDNTVNQTRFRGAAVPPMASLIAEAHRLGYGILFNTGRDEKIRGNTLALLRHDGYPVDGLCMRRSGEPIAHSKQRCRDEYARRGWTLVANIGNTPPDMAGDGFEMGVPLPNYRMALP